MSKTQNPYDFGAVSKETAIEMVTGTLEALSCTFAVAITGIAGLAGGTSAKPVGTHFRCNGPKIKYK